MQIKADTVEKSGKLRGSLPDFRSGFDEYKRRKSFPLTWVRESRRAGTRSGPGKWHWLVTVRYEPATRAESGILLPLRTRFAGVLSRRITAGVAELSEEYRN